MRENSFPAEAERWSREHDSNVRARACDLRFKGGSVRPLPHPGKMEPRIGFEPMSSRLKGEHPGPLDERGDWSGLRDSNSLCQLGRLMHNPYAKPAQWRRVQESNLPDPKVSSR